MKNELKKKFPEWIYDDLARNQDLMLGDDVDSLLGNCLLNHITDGKWKTNYFYDFESFYRHEQTGNHAIGVDMALTKNVKTFDNHVTQQASSSDKNHYMVNPNLVYNITTGKPYHKKYPLSTLILIMALYDIPLPKDDIGKDIVLAVDSSFKGHYTSNKYFKDIHTTWLERMGMMELFDRLNSKPIQYFYNLQQEYGLGEKIHINEEGLLSTDINIGALQSFFDYKIELPSQEFKLLRECNVKRGSINNTLPDRSNLISLAYTFGNSVCYTYK